MAENENSRLNNINATVRDNPRARTTLIILGIIVLILFGYGIMRVISSSNGPKKDLAGGASVPNSPEIKAIPGQSNSPEYNRLVNEANKKREEDAQKKGTSVVPVLGGQGQGGLIDPLQNQPVAAPPPVPTPPPAPVYTPPPQQAQQNVPQMPTSSSMSGSGDRQAAYEKAQKQVMQYLGMWTKHPGDQEFNYTAQLSKTALAGANGSNNTNADGSTANGTASTASNNNGPVYIRAGTIVPAQLLTPINSDAPGPVIAEITSGPFAGARVIGSFQANDNQVVVQFSKLSMPGLDKSLQISAYAVSGDMSPGLATDVNHHYLAKYGLGLAAAFISGYGEAVGRQNTVITTGPFGSTVSQGNLSNSQIAKVAVGQVGTQLGSDIQSDTSSMRPTVKAAGQHGEPLPIGLLFMSDF